MDENRTANRLAKSTSPYLQQHAFNPVDWYPWGEEAFDKAIKNDLPMLISIGYSACHWCHVMEKESFENDQIAKEMNDHFVCIKVDREERPDVDQIYMDAVQNMGINGGWPLNIFATPSKEPFYGGTYFPPDNWYKILKGVSRAYKNDRNKIEKSAREFKESLSVDDTVRYGIKPTQFSISNNDFIKVTSAFKPDFETRFGGMGNAPKFPMPSIWHFLLLSLTINEDKEVENQVKLTLNKMSLGGIFDQLAGGFSRYSVDEKWFAPHFEKMMYDNGQLLSLYSEAFRHFKYDHYKITALKIVDWMREDMRDEFGGFYSALDADSEGEEGLFYTWEAEELNGILGDNYPTFADFFGIEPKGNWEKNRNILHADMNVSEFADNKDLDLSTLKVQLEDSKKKLLTQRLKRIAPGLDNKIITGWNGMALRGLTDAYSAFGLESLKEMAVNNAEFLYRQMFDDGELFRINSGRTSISGTLEDYAFVIHGLIGLYEITFEEKWILWAKQLCDKAIGEFYEEKSGLFYYASRNSLDLIARKKELFDNVIPSSNSQMGINLHFLSRYFYNDEYDKMSEKMVSNVMGMLTSQPRYLSNWAKLLYFKSFPTAEIVISGKDPLVARKEMIDHPVFNAVFVSTNNKIPLSNGKPESEERMIYVCYNKTCKLPVKTVNEALEQINFGISN